MKKTFIFVALFLAIFTSCSTNHSNSINNQHISLIDSWFNQNFDKILIKNKDISKLKPLIYTSNQRLEDLQSVLNLHTEEEVNSPGFSEYIKNSREKIKNEIENFDKEKWDSIVGYECICNFNIVIDDVPVFYEYKFKFDKLFNIRIVEDVSTENIIYQKD